jgi:hypothetical protein
MQSMLQGLSVDELKDIAAYFTSLKGLTATNYSISSYLPANFWHIVRRINIAISRRTMTTSAGFKSISSCINICGLRSQLNRRIKKWKKRRKNLSSFYFVFSGTLCC